MKRFLEKESVTSEKSSGKEIIDDDDDIVIEIDEQEGLNPTKKANRSIVWTHFNKTEKPDFAECKHCKKIYKTFGNTSNLQNHLNRCLAGEKFNANAPSSSKSTVEYYFNKLNAYSNDTDRKKKLNEALIVMVCEDYQPFDIVNDTGINNFVSLLDSRYSIPSKSTLRDTILPAAYEHTKRLLRNILNKVENMAITTDMWTSRTSQSFITITSHFVDQNFELRSAVLTTRLLNDSTNHSAQNISDTLKEVFDEWLIKGEKITGLVTETAASMVKVGEILRVRHLGCFAHTINLAVQDVLKLDLICPVLNKCREVIKFFKYSTISTDILNKEQTGAPKKLIKDVVTRWKSVYYMISRIIEIKDAINSSLLKIKKAPQTFTLEEINALTDFMQSLAIFENATKKITGTKYVTLSLIIPLSFGIYNELLHQKNKMITVEGKNFADKLIESVKKRLFIYESRSLPRIATILDPRFKKEGFREESNSTQSAILLEDELRFFLQKKKSQPQQSQQNVEPENSSNEKPHEESLFSFLNERIECKSKTSTLDAILIKKHYLEEKNVSLSSTSKSNPLLYWKNFVGTDFEPLVYLSKKYLCIPASSVESERVFSKAGQLLNEKRSRLKPENLDKLIFMKHNKWVKEEQNNLQ